MAQSTVQRIHPPSATMNQVRAKLSERYSYPIILANRTMVDAMIFPNSKNFIESNAIAGLDELARVTLSNDNEPQYDVSRTVEPSFDRFSLSRHRPRVMQLIFGRVGM
jgi:hypothetical protein